MAENCQYRSGIRFFCVVLTCSPSRSSKRPTPGRVSLRRAFRAPLRNRESRCPSRLLPFRGSGRPGDAGFDSCDHRVEARQTVPYTATRMTDLNRAVRESSRRSEEHTSELQSLMRNSYAVFCLKKKNTTMKYNITHTYITINHTR